MAFRDSLDRFEQFATDVILERRFGKGAMLLRWLLYGLSWIFRAGAKNLFGPVPASLLKAETLMKLL